MGLSGVHFKFTGHLWHHWHHPGVHYEELSWTPSGGGGHPPVLVQVSLGFYGSFLNKMTSLSCQLVKLQDE